MSSSDPTAGTSLEGLETASPEVKHYQRLKLTASVVSFLLGLALIATAALVLGPWVDHLVHRITGENRWLRLIALGFVYAAALELVTLPVAFWSGFLLEHRFGLSTQKLPGWVWRQVKEYLVAGPIGLILLLGLYTLLWYAGNWWWVGATIGWLVVSLVLGQLLPVVILPLFYKITLLDDPALRQRLEQLTQGTGLTLEGVYRLDLSAETRKANAALAGMGRTRRVLLGDTLLQQFTPEEVEVVFAHEVGHHVHRHVLKIIVLGIVLAAGGFWLVDLVLQHSALALSYRSFNDPAALPLVLLVLTLFGLLLSPLEKAISRHFERQADRYALQRTQQRQAYCSAFLKLARLNKSDPRASSAGRLVVPRPSAHRAAPGHGRGNR